MSKLTCPYCDRRLQVPVQNGLVTCDCCEKRFDPSKVRVQPAPWPKRACGGALVVLGILLLIVALASLPRYDLHESDGQFAAVGAFLPGGFALFGGLALGRGKLVIDDSPHDNENDPDELVSGVETHEEF